MKKYKNLKMKLKIIIYISLLTNKVEIPNKYIRNSIRRDYIKAWKILINCKKYKTNLYFKKLIILYLIYFFFRKN